MSTHPANAGRDQVDVHNRLDRVVFGVAPDHAEAIETTLTPEDARQIARALLEAADAAERTPSS